MDSICNQDKDTLYQCFCRRAQAYEDVGQFGKAAACLERALRLNYPEEGEEQGNLRIRLAKVLRNCQKNAEALKEFQRALEIGCMEARSAIYFEMGKLYHRQRQHEEALDHYQKAIDQGDGALAGDVYYHMAATHRRMRSLDESVTCYEKARGLRNERSVEDWEIDNSLSVAYIEFEAFPEAQLCLDRIKDKLDVVDIPGVVYHNLGRVAEHFGRLDEAEDYYGNTADDPQTDTSARGHDMLGRLYESQKHFGKALTQYRKALEKYERALAEGITSPESARGNIAAVKDSINGLLRLRILECFKIKGPCKHESLRLDDKKVFIAMPYGNDAPSRMLSKALYKDGFEPAVMSGEVAGLSVSRVDRALITHDVLCMICTSIQECGTLIADISGGNPNVMYEIGLAHALQKRVVLVANTDDIHADRIPFDIRSFKVHEYGSTDDLTKTVSAVLKALYEPPVQA